MAVVGNFNFSYFLRLTWEFLDLESERGGSVYWPNNKIIDYKSFQWELNHHWIKGRITSDVEEVSQNHWRKWHYLVFPWIKQITNQLLFEERVWVIINHQTLRICVTLETTFAAMNNTCVTVNSVLPTCLWNFWGGKWTFAF